MHHASSRLSNHRAIIARPERGHHSIIDPRRRAVATGDITLSNKRPTVTSSSKTRGADSTPRAERVPVVTTVTASDEIQALSGDPNFMTSLARGLAVIRGFSQQRRKMSIAQLSLRTGIPRAAVRRCLYTLTKLGYVGAEDGATFALRPQILALGHAYLSSVPLVMAAQPVLIK